MSAARMGVSTSHGIDKITCEQQGWEWPHLMGQVRLDYEEVRRMVASTFHGSGKVPLDGEDGSVHTSRDRKGNMWKARI